MRLVEIGVERWILTRLFDDASDRAVGYLQRAYVRGNAVINRGESTPAIRRERIRKEILSRGLQDELAGRVRGRGETWSQLFHRVYGEPLVIAGATQELPL